MKWLRQTEMKDPHHHWWERIANGVMILTGTAARRGAWIAVLVAVPLALTMILKPEFDYLPEGNRNLIFSFINPPPGHNLDTIEKEMGSVLAQKLAPYLEGKQQPQVLNYFFVAFSSGAFMGIRTVDPERTGELLPVINGILRGFPDTIGFAFRASLFGGFGGGGIDMDLQGRDIETVLAAAQGAFMQVRQALPGASVRPFPGLDLTSPELQLVPDERRIAEAGWNRATVSGVVRALGDGVYVGDYFDGEQRLDIILRAEPWLTPEDLASMPVATPGAGTQLLGDLVNIERTAGPEELRRVDRRRTVTLQIRPPDGMSLDEAMRILREKVEPVVMANMPGDGTVQYTGTANKLDTAILNMAGSFLLAVVILYLLISALFRSFVDSLLVLGVIPLATVGGVIALAVTNQLVSQNLDLLTMIGFVILLGLVVNNAILLVHQTRSAERNGKSRRQAVNQAVHLRLRPILMSTLTSIFGMLPLLLMPGAGTELYRGMAAVIVGGMMVSTVFTLILLPSLLRIGEARNVVQDNITADSAGPSAS